MAGRRAVSGLPFETFENDSPKTLAAMALSCLPLFEHLNSPLLECFTSDLEEKSQC